MAEEKRASLQAGMTLAEALVWIVLIIAGAALIIADKGEWLIGLAIIAFFLL